MSIERLSKDHFLIKELIDSYREEWQRKQGQRDKENRAHFYISDVSKCNREIFYCFFNSDKKRTIADKTLILFRCGDLYHEEIQFRLKKQRVIDNSRDLEFGLEDYQLETTGRLDVFAQDNGGLTVTELKAKNPYGYLNEQPDQNEADQLLWYIFAAKNSKALKERKINNYGYIIYQEGWPISDFPLTGWRVDYDEERVNHIRERFRNLKTDIENKAIPQRPHERDSIKCNYCRFKEFCWQGIPEAKPPALKADESIEKPEKELVESAENRYVQLKEEIAEREKEIKEIYDILMKYFLATGTEETDRLRHIFSKQTKLDEEYLLSKFKDSWHLIAKPQIKLIQKAIEEGNMDPEIFERSKKIEFNHQIRIKKEGGFND